MLRTIFLLGLFVMLGIFALRILFGVLGGIVALVIWLITSAIWISAVGLVVYVIVRIVSPETARRIRRKFSGSSP